jgi:hypothetical protein
VAISSRYDTPQVKRGDVYHLKDRTDVFGGGLVQLATNRATGRVTPAALDRITR